eukprot:2089165-Amphidinium_carterae.1
MGRIGAEGGVSPASAWSSPEKSAAVNKGIHPVVDAGLTVQGPSLCAWAGIPSSSQACGLKPQRLCFGDCGASVSTMHPLDVLEECPSLESLYDTDCPRFGKDQPEKERASHQSS